jgi:hypothetical protein
VADYSFGSQMGLDDPDSDSLGNLLTYGAKSDEETAGQPNSQPNVKSDASAPIAPAAHVQAVMGNTTVQPAQAAPSTVQAATTASPLPIQPPMFNGPDPDELQALQQQKAKDEVVSNVSPKWWERLAGGLSAGAMAFGKVPGAVEAGQNVTYRGQNAAEEQRQGRLKSDDVGIQAWQDGQKDAQQSFNNQHTAFEDQDRAQSRRQLDADRAAQESQRQQGIAPGTEAPDDPKNPLGGWHATTVGGKPIALEGPPDKWTKSPVGVQAVRDKYIADHKLTGDDAKFYSANGKLKETSPTNIKIPSEGQQAYNDAMNSWRNENPGKKPTLADLRTIRSAADGKTDTTSTPKRGTAGQFSSLDKETAASYAKAEAEYKAAADPGASAEDKASALATLNAEKARIGAEHSQRLRDLGGVPAEDSTPQSKAPAPQAAPKPNTPLTDPVKAKAYLAAAGGDKAKARAAAAKDGWKF